jgi:hypothetical protein
MLNVHPLADSPVAFSGDLQPPFLTNPYPECKSATLFAIQRRRKCASGHHHLPFHHQRNGSNPFMRIPAPRTFILVLVLFVFTTIVRAAESNSPAGTWVLRIGQRNLFVVTLNKTGDQFRGSFDCPAKMNSAANLFYNIAYTTRHDAIVNGTVKDGILHITVQNAADPKDRNMYTLTVTGDHAELAYDDLPPGTVIEPRILERASIGATVATDWEPNRAYVAGDSDTSNPEMKAIFDEDQRVRQPGQTSDWSVVGKTDIARREQTRKLLASGALHTGKDFEEAAFLFQHGDKPDDYLLAHTLAMVAVSKGDAMAIWIASATLDRYLVNIKQKQIFGTQYNNAAPTGSLQTIWTQEPYDRTLVSDALRQQLGVPAQSTQAKQLTAYQNEK